jgi:hypothetical protein
MNDVLRQLGKPRSLTVNIVGSKKSQDAAVKLGEFLKLRGFDVSYGVLTAMLVPPLEQPIELRSDGLWVDTSK